MPATGFNRRRYETAVERLREICASRGTLRVPDEERRRTQTWQTYKHGYELTFNVRVRSELVQLQRLLKVVGVAAGRPYRADRGHVLPVYGTERVLRAIIDLGLNPKRPCRREVSGGPAAPRVRSPVARRALPATRPAARGDVRGEMKDPRQLRVAMRLFNKGPLSTRELKTTRALLGQMRERGLVAALPLKNRGPRVWALTLKGLREIRRKIRYGHR